MNFLILQKLFFTPIFLPLNLNYQLLLFTKRLAAAKKEVTGRMIRERGRRREKEGKRESKKKKWEALK